MDEAKYSFRAIAGRCGVSQATVGDRARKERRAHPGGAAGAGRQRKRKGLPPSAATAGIRGGLALRLYSVIEFRIRMMELRMQKQLELQQKALAEGEPAPPAEDERETFAALIANIDQVMELDTDTDRAADGRGKSAIRSTGAIGVVTADPDASADALASEADAFRPEIAERLEKLFPRP
jgi:hypothetical protein